MVHRSSFLDIGSTQYTLLVAGYSAVRCPPEVPLGISSGGRLTVHREMLKGAITFRLGVL